MIQEIMRDTAFLAQKAESATLADLPVAENLLDTLAAHKEGCVGMAANMIGINKRIIAFNNEGSYIVMFNLEIIKKAEPYEAEEGKGCRVLRQPFIVGISESRLRADSCIRIIRWRGIRLIVGRSAVSFRCGVH